MPHEPRADTPPPEAERAGNAEPGERSPGSELEEGLDHLGKAVGGLLTRLLGPRYTQVELEPDKPVLGAEADAAVDRAGATMGRWLKAAGDGLKSHPTDPIAALDHASKHRDEEPELREGEAPLAAGARAFAGGLYRSTEAVLDAVAPRRPKAGAKATPDEAPPGSEDPTAEPVEDEASLG